MTQIIIDIGASANDGTGDPIRTAFNDVNLNFDQLFNAGPVGSNIQITNNQITALNTNGNLYLSPNGIGVVVSATDILPSYTVARNLGSPNYRWNTVYTRYLDISGVFRVGNLEVSGNLILDQDLSVNGNITGSSISVSTATITDSLVGANASFTGNTILNTLDVNTANFANVGNLHIPGGNNGYYLQTDGNGGLSWTAGGGSGNGEVGGANTQVQFNNDGNFGGSPNFTWDGATVGVVGTVNTTSLVANQSTTLSNSVINGNLLVGGNQVGAGLNIYNVPTGNGVILKAPPLSGQDVVLTLPNSVGTVNQVLTTDGTGVTSWQTAASPYGNANVAAYLPTYTGSFPSLTGVVQTTSNVVAGNLVTNGNIYIGNTPFTRTLTVARQVSPVTIPLASNNSFNVLTMSGNVAVYTT